jgi:hypothetical protein
MNQSGFDSETSGNSPRKVNHYIKYSGIGIQMFAIIGFGCYGGVKLNAYLEFEKPYITAAVSLLSIVLAMVYAFRQVQK